MLEIIARKWAARMRGRGRREMMLDGTQVASSRPRTLATHTPRGGSIHLLAGGQLHEAADKSRIPDPVQFYIYRRRGVRAERCTVTPILSLSLLLFHTSIRIFSRRFPPSLGRAKRSKGSERQTEREGCHLSRGWGRGALRWSCDYASERDGWWAAVCVCVCARARARGCTCVWVWRGRGEGAIMCACTCT